MGKWDKEAEAIRKQRGASQTALDQKVQRDQKISAGAMPLWNDLRTEAQVAVKEINEANEGAVLFYHSDDVYDFSLRYNLPAEEGKTRAIALVFNASTHGVKESGSGNLPGYSAHQYGIVLSADDKLAWSESAVERTNEALIRYIIKSLMAAN